MENNFQIYKITNLVNGKCYIGQTIRNIKVRWGRHKYDARKGSSSYLHKAIRKYGEESFMIEIITNAFKREFLNALEVISIAQHDTFIPLGYNLTTGGGANTIFSCETKKKLSLIHKGNTYCLGYRHTTEAKKNMSTAQKGSKRSEEAKKNMSTAQKGNKNNLGKKLSPVTRNKISMANKGNTNGKGNLGRKFSNETKRKMSVAHQGKTKGLLSPRSRGLIYTPLWYF